MKRTADSTIKGFLYQFNKTILSIVHSSDEEQITVEGLIEDIDIQNEKGGLLAIQCKYHESVEKFSDSLIFKPILQMAETFSKAPSSDVTFRIFIHVPGEVAGLRNLTTATLNAALNTSNVDLKKIADRITSPIVNPAFDKATFLSKVQLDFGPSIDELEVQTKDALSELKIGAADTDCVLYPNALSHISKLSSLKEDSKRKITKKEFLQKLKGANSTAISKWVLALKNKKQILSTIRNQLSMSLGQNSRERFIYFSRDSIDDFDDGIVNFISEFLLKYHNKAAHIKTPLIAIDCNQDEIGQLEHRLFKKDIKVNTGIVGPNFEVTELYRDPVVCRSRTHLEREFSLRLLHTNPEIQSITFKKCDDIFFVSDTIPNGVELTDVHVHQVGVTNFKELAYVFSLRGNYE